MSTVIIETHGCKLNQADSQALARRFTLAGYQVVGPGQPSDVYVLDTCTVTQMADRKARHALRAAHRQNSKALIVATGCYAQRDPAKLGALPEVDLVLGNTDKDMLVQEIISFWKDVLGTSAVGKEVSGKGMRRARAMVKIQEGCNQVCAYCIVPKVRGRERSIPADGLVAQIGALEEGGFQEVVLTGTQIGSYGFDIPGASLFRLIELMLNKTTIPRIRVSSLQPQVLGEELLGLWQDPRLCPHFHMPLQSGSDAVLRRMGRHYTADLFAHTAERVRARVPHASITTDVLTGFPGESEEEFQETYRFCRDIRFSGMHIFPYSVRPGTSAALFQGKIDPVTKGLRGRQLLQLAQEHAFDFRVSLLGQIRPVLWESRDPGDSRERWSGLTDNYVRVFTEEPRFLGNTITVTRLLEEQDGSLYGQVVD
ncbi:MAG: tRNA (N(6)-L-threonylcarbamoyladenosine(37)-C(2))-methylthiotransferase MtaB [Chloroflexota bacterium]